MANDVQILPFPVSNAPNDWTLPGSLRIVPRAINAVFDGTSAAGSFLPAVEIISDSGHVVARVLAETAVSAGGSAEVTFAPFLRSGLGSQNLQTFVGARIYNSAAQSIVFATANDLRYNTVLIDTDGMVNLAADNRKLTAQTAGFYLVQLGVTYVPNGTGRRLGQIFLNGFYSAGTGTQIGFFSTAAVADPGAATAAPAVTLIFLNVGDFITAGTYQNSGGALNTIAGQVESFSAALVGAA